MALTKITGQGVGTVDEVLIQKASSGATATSGTVLTVEDDDNTALSILGGSSSVLALNFGHSGDNNEGILSFNTTSGSEDMLLSSTKDITLRTTSTNAAAPPTTPAATGSAPRNSIAHRRFPTALGTRMPQVITWATMAR